MEIEVLRSFIIDNTLLSRLKKDLRLLRVLSITPKSFSSNLYLLHDSMMNGSNAVQFIFQSDESKIKLKVVSFLFRQEMVDTVFHSEPYTKEELCEFFGLSVCLC